MNLSHLTPELADRGIVLGYENQSEDDWEALGRRLLESEQYIGAVTGAIQALQSTADKTGSVGAPQFHSVLAAGVVIGWYIREVAGTVNGGIDDVLAQIAKDARKGEQ